VGTIRPKRKGAAKKHLEEKAVKKEMWTTRVFKYCTAGENIGGSTRQS